MINRGCIPPTRFPGCLRHQPAAPPCRAGCPARPPGTAAAAPRRPVQPRAPPAPAPAARQPCGHRRLHQRRRCPCRCARGAGPRPSPRMVPAVGTPDPSVPRGPLWAPAETLVRPGRGCRHRAVSGDTGSGSSCRRCTEHGHLAGGAKDTRARAAPRVRGTPGQMPVLRTSPGAGPRRGCGLGAERRRRGTGNSRWSQGGGVCPGSRCPAPRKESRAGRGASSQPAWGGGSGWCPQTSSAPLRGPSLLSIRALGEFALWRCPTWRVPWGRGHMQAS